MKRENLAKFHRRIEEIYGQKQDKGQRHLWATLKHQAQREDADLMRRACDEILDDDVRRQAHQVLDAWLDLD